MLVQKVSQSKTSPSTTLTVPTTCQLLVHVLTASSMPLLIQEPVPLTSLDSISIQLLSLSRLDIRSPIETSFTT